VLAVDNASVRSARPHVHTGTTERLLGSDSQNAARAFPTLWGTSWDGLSWHPY